MVLTSDRKTLVLNTSFRTWFRFFSISYSSWTNLSFGRLFLGTLPYQLMFCCAYILVYFSVTMLYCKDVISYDFSSLAFPFPRVVILCRKLINDAANARLF